MSNWISKCSVRTIIFFCIVSAQLAWSVTEINDPAIPKLVSHFKTSAKTPAQHLAEHEADVNACKDTFNLLKKDAAFIKNWDYSSTTTLQTSTALLSKSIYAKEAPLQWLINNPSRIKIGRENYTGGYFVVARMDEFYCATELPLRLFLLEQLGSSFEAWKLKKELLNELLDLHFPYMDASYGYSFESLVREIERSKRLYRGNELLALKQWVNQAAASIKRHDKNVRDFVEGLSPERQRTMIRNWSHQLEVLSQ